MKAVLTVVGSDSVGILAEVALACAKLEINIEEVTQSILAGTFAMIMVVDLSRCTVDFEAAQASLAAAGVKKGVEVKMTRRELYDTMHRI
ncbi:MAG: ACT domain-containing protein [Clostridia bacterium]|nr:ACT domain-containing protein [Clostridia bacterium]